ncbi:hypothetical protein PM10SUCC1_22080 [Propionigenium maris DSM 9537]|uniref:Uncharacterized protein n=1 Tax=Propionigenium maris DSM 9537 TaxID=1123000 RepID=A0A9W6GK98_9FUSO|nr:hypothetical protein [Propionigenium maris]GLI56694.1 hypothetical protein PM10SUCC1_22080 [Propionigenium maris DSM 9537]
MKKIILILFIALSLNVVSATPSYMDERGFMEKTLIKLRLRKDISKSFKYSKLKVYSKRSGGYRRIQGRIKNQADGDFQWATFKVMLGEKKNKLEEVYRFTIHNFEKNKTYFLDSNVYVGDTKGKEMQIVYVNSEEK